MGSAFFDIIADEVCRTAHRMAHYPPFFWVKENRPEDSQSGIFKSAATYFHKPFPANYLGHE